MFKKGLTEACIETLGDYTKSLKEKNFIGELSDQEYLADKVIVVSIMQILVNQMDLSEQLSELHKSMIL